jgi:hypothetical protein
MTDLMEINALIATRHAALGKVYIQTPTVKEGLEAIHSLRLFGHRPPDGRAMCGTLWGSTNSGKTRLFAEYMKREDTKGTEDVYPVLLVSLPKPFGLAAFYNRILVECGGHDFSGGKSPEHVAQRMKHFLKERKVELILAEELNHIVDQTLAEAKRPYWAADQIKLHILDEAKVPVFFNGIAVSEKLFTRNTQLHSRRQDKVEFFPFRWEDELERERFKLIIEAFDKAAAFPVRIGLGEPARLQRIHRATTGVPGEVYNLFHKAIEIGTKRQADAIDMSILAEAHAARANAGPGWVNILSVPVLPPLAMPDDSRVTKLHQDEPRRRGRPRKE